MKRLLGIIVCLTLILSNLAFCANAEEEKMIYNSFINGSSLGAAAADIIVSTNAQEISQNTQEGYITVVPVDGVTGSLNQWGGFVMKLRVEMKGAQTFDFEDSYDDMYIRTKIKSTTPPQNIWVKTDRNNGNGWSASVNRMVASTPDADNWYEGLISFKSVLKDDLGKKVTSFKNIYIGFGYANGTEVTAVDIAEVSIVGPDVREKPETVKTEMNSSGNYCAELEYTAPLGSGAADKSNYMIGDISAENLTVNGNKISVEFDMQPDFPSELTLKISENAKCADGYPLYPNIKLKNEHTFAASLNDGYTLEVKDGKANFSGSIRCIYDKVGDGISITAFVAVYDESDESSFVTGGFSETKTVAHKESGEFEVKIEDNAIKPGMTAKLFIIDTAEVGRPLAAIR